MVYSLESESNSNFLVKLLQRVYCTIRHIILIPRLIDYYFRSEIDINYFRAFLAKVIEKEVE